MNIEGIAIGQTEYGWTPATFVYPAAIMSRTVGILSQQVSSIAFLAFTQSYHLTFVQLACQRRESHQRGLHPVFFRKCVCFFSPNTAPFTHFVANVCSFNITELFGGAPVKLVRLPAVLHWVGIGKVCLLGWAWRGGWGRAVNLLSHCSSSSPIDVISRFDYPTAAGYLLGPLAHPGHRHPARYL